MIAAILRSESLSCVSGFRQILGVKFFGGTAREAFSMIKSGGLLVAPAAPALLGLSRNSEYRDALLNADLCITDSGFMVTIWNGFHRDKLYRLSGLEYLRFILSESEVRTARNTLWVMANEASRRHHLAWLASEGIQVPDSHCYEAPIYGIDFEDRELIERIEMLRPAHIIVTIGGGKQELLGHYLVRTLARPPAIHCIGGAIGFLSGDQVKIPMWADRHRLGYAFRCLSNPRAFVPRYWEARKLLWLMLQYGSELPPMRRPSE